MGLRCTAASSTRIFNAAPVLPSTGYPMTVGCWFKAYGTTAGSLYAFSDSGTTTNYLEAALSSGVLSVGANAGAGVTSANSALPVVAGRWDFVLARFISATNRWISHYVDPRVATQVQNVTSRAPTSLDDLSIGGRGASTPANFFDGVIAEFWYLDTALAADPAVAIADHLVRELAHRGPFALPNTIDNIVEWRGLRVSSGSDTDDGYDVYSRVGPQTWQYSATKPITAEHPPLGPNYIRPGQVKSFLMV